MINLTDSQIDHLAERIIISYCRDEICNHISHEFNRHLKDELEKPHKEFFDTLFKAIAPYERKFAEMLKEIWRRQEKLIIANLKKLKKAYMGKDKGDDILASVMYPEEEMRREMEKKCKSHFEVIMEKEGQRVVNVHDLNVAFDVTNPEVQKWLKDYIFVFSEALEAVNQDVLRRELIAGLEAGEGIPKLMKRVNTTYANWYKSRSMNIARSEVIRASNKGALESYRQSGVVKRKEWLTHFDGRECAWCAEMNGTPISIEETWFDKGDEFTIDVEGKSQTMNLNYTDIDAPPLHAMCRCTIVPVIE